MEETIKKGMTENAFSGFVGIIFLRGSNQQKYRSLQKKFQMEYANNCDRYTKSLVRTMEMTRHLYINGKKENSKDRRDKEGNKKNSTPESSFL